MLNTPNEWHNEEYTEDEKAPEDFANGEYDEGYSDDGYSDEEYSEEDEYVDGDDDGSDGTDSNSKNKIIIIAVVAAVALVVIIGGIIGFTAMKNKNSSVPEQQPPVEAVEELGIDIGSEEGEEEISIDVESEDETIAENPEENSEENQEIAAEGGLDVPANEQQQQTANNANSNEEAPGGLEVPQKSPKSPLAGVVGGTASNGTVSIAIGDTGRANPFKPNVEPQNLNLPAVKDVNAVREKYSFDVIEPPELGIENLDLERLMQTKVTGILYDNIKPSAIVNIDGSDQLVNIGDNIAGFEIVSITKNKVVIKDGSNVFRASVGQPLNAEKVVNPVEISNLENKFAGSTKH
ncbi:MAG: hypothetical protein ACI37T_00900 [Candidatus Gastranaerophilaceae bacterium]